MIRSGESDFWAGLFEDLSVRVEWLEQAIDGIPKDDASAAAVVRLRSYQHALHELRVAIEHAQAHRGDAYLKPLFTLEGPLANYLSRLYGWCQEMGTDFERMAAAMRRREPTTTVFSHKAVNESYAQFETIVAAVRTQYEVAHGLHARDDEPRWRAFDERLEELIWSAEWLHMTLARPPGH